MKRVIYLSLIVGSSIQAEEVLDDISVSYTEETTQVVRDIGGEELKSADLAEALHKNVPSISLIRRSGIANDITLRGQKRDNINVTIDGAKIYGACVNRMDPPTSHVLTNAIADVEVQEGAFDVEEFGSLSGSVKIKTKKPTKGVHGDISLNGGSFDYQKFSGTISGGTDKVKALFSTSVEQGGQYEDGNGDNFSEQLSHYTSGTASSTDDTFNYTQKNRDMDAFEKKMYMGKLFINFSSDQNLEMSYTANRSDNVLYPSSKMDAIYDDSDILNFKYAIKNLGSYSKKVELQLYDSQVEHPMSTEFREIGKEKYMTHKLTTEMKGLKLKNTLDAFDGVVTYGVDTSQRNWDGKYMMTMRKAGQTKDTGKSIDDVDTKNVAFFIKSEKKIGDVKLGFGTRYDDTTITTDSTTEKGNDYQALSANIFATYKANKSTKYFAGIGKSSRVPDGRELYNTKYKAQEGKAPQKILNGNPNLEQTTNYEIDLGVEKNYDSGNLKMKTFYSKLKDYIYYNGNPDIKKSNFENIDASIYGLELSGGYMPSDNSYIEASLAYKKGKKDSQTRGQSNDNLADISPLKVNLKASYDYDEQGAVELSLIASDRWDEIDNQNGEQELAGYAVLNFKTTREFDNGVALTVGVDNLLDKNYAMTNTYKDLILMTDGATNTMLINEPGRYLYVNAKYQF